MEIDCSITIPEITDYSDLQGGINVCIIEREV